MRSAKYSSAVLMVLQFIIAVQLAFAQCENKTGFAKRACEANNPTTNSGSGLPVSLGLGNAKTSALTTSITDSIHLEILPPTVDPRLFTPLANLDRTDDGSFILKVGIFEAYVQSYTLDAGDTNANKPAGYYPAPIKGKKAKVIGIVLKQVELHPNVPQTDIQQLLLAILQGTDLEKMSDVTRQAALVVLPRDIIKQMQGATQAKAFQNNLLGILNQHAAKDPNAQKTISDIGNINNTIKKVAGGDASLRTMDEIPDPIARGTWAEMPGGFYVRYLPEGYAKTRVQVIVPDAAIQQADPKSPLVFDPTQYLAVLSEVPNERIGITMRPAR